MSRYSKLIIIIALFLIFIRIINPVLVATNNGRTFEADPLFDKGKRTYQFVMNYGVTSMTNLLHIFYIILFVGAFIFLLEKN